MNTIKKYWDKQPQQWQTLNRSQREEQVVVAIQRHQQDIQTDL